MKSQAWHVCLFIFLVSICASAQTLEQRPADDMAMAQPNGPAKAPNVDATYQALRSIGLANESFTVNNFVLKRDAGEFTFKSGSFQFTAAVNGKVTGAVFMGEGSFTMTPPLPSERRSLFLLTKEPSGIHEDFGVVVFRFTDGTYDEIKKVAGASSSGGAAGEFDSIHKAMRTKIHFNLDARILQDVLSDQPGGLFVAFIKGKKYSSKEIFEIDPRGDPAWGPEEVVFETWDDMNSGEWCAFHLSDEYKTGLATGTQKNAVISIDRQALDTQMESNGKLNGNAKTEIIALQDDVRVVPFDLFPTLRVSSVSNAAGEQLDFIQEKKDDDPQFSVVLPKPLKKGDKYLIRTIYNGKDAVSDEGGGNYYPVAREDWFPNVFPENFGNYATYDMTFRVPKSLTIVATGTPVKNVMEGKENVTEWKSEVPQPVAGFSVGSFKKLEAKDPRFTAEAYANDSPPDEAQSVLRVASAMGSMDTTGMMKKALAEAQIAMDIYSNYFGASPYKRIAMTQQTACNYGQSWPALVYLPICYFYDDTQRHQLGVDSRGYWMVVGPHEVAHQWWGHMVGFASYRDQWMCEGFAEESASLFIQSVWPSQKLLDFWKQEHDLLTEKDREGFRAIDVGPLTMGYRLNNAKAGETISRRLIYPKGGYVLHMLREMMFDRQTKDQRFRDMMHDFVAAYTNKPATTEDFKAIVEKHMTPQMDLDGNHKMDWFFNEYVYGTELPTYTFEQSFDDKLNLKFKLTQSNVSPNFKMSVPIYLELANGNVVRLGSQAIAGDTSAEQVIPLGAALKEKPKRAMINYFYDVLAQ